MVWAGDGLIEPSALHAILAQHPILVLYSGRVAAHIAEVRRLME
jgi:hypothetical protein